ncbi:hypothetical protein I5677_07720 [Mobilitalea sibirica]|uniref:Uncharacterized protein n=1 Tax=Mobilitalea sibirica TaxID=1462919 RepID=A0A8J7H265_9FIRM|nr:hypothetical protein [Mobilitalea sibirica]MBH1940772.1 hypothetical protein [Mobilitalea sibirica]
MSKQSNQKYRKERGLNHKERAKNTNSNNMNITTNTSANNTKNKDE